MSSRSSSPSADPAIDRLRLANLLGAWALAVSDRIDAGAAASAGRGGQAPAALVALHQFAGGSTIEELRHVLGLSHSAAVRLIDGLVADGYVARGQAAGDRRSVALSLTTSGRSAARRIGAARLRAVESTLEGLTDAETRALTKLAERLTGELAGLRLNERRQGAPPAGGWLCRLCDFRACGRPEGRCPAAISVASSPDGGQAG
jgi:MarR family transcriptional regulator, negative regulator of the multidrug operon emrRAB